MLDLLYARGVEARRRWYERHPGARRRLRQPVISVGNLSVGGTGKTPLVATIAEWLRARGERPAILSRGYHRRDRPDGVVVVADANRVLATVDTAGDEPLMLARALPGVVVCVCEDRFLAGALAERQLGATVHVLDDGFQHVQLSRDFDVLVTSVGEITRGRVLPFGKLREARSAAARAQFVVVMEADLDAARNEAWELGISQFAAARRTITGASGASRATGLARRSSEGAEAGAAGAGEYAVFAVAGIGKPEQFFAMLRDAGYQVVGTMAFADHRRYSAKDVARVEAAARGTGAAVVLTTAKDSVRFEPLGPLPFELRAVEMSLLIEGWDGLTASLEQALVGAREPG